MGEDNNEAQPQSGDLERIVMWMVTTAPHETRITECDLDQNCLDRKGWSYGGDAEFYKAFLTEDDANYGLREYLRNEISRMEDIILESMIK